MASDTPRASKPIKNNEIKEKDTDIEKLADAFFDSEEKTE